MKTIGIQIKGAEAIVVVLEKDFAGNITQTNECSKFKIDDHLDNEQVKQFRDQVNTAFHSIGAIRIGLVVRNAKGKGDRVPSPVSFKLEGVIQLYDKLDIEFVWPQTTTAHFKKYPKKEKSKNAYQENAFDVAYFLINQ